MSRCIGQPHLHCIRLTKFDHKVLTKTTERLIHALVICYIDYCNRLFYGLPDNQVQKRQVIQYAAARLVTRTTNMSPALHWLHIRSRIGCI